MSAAITPPIVSLDEILSHFSKTHGLTPRASTISAFLKHTRNLHPMGVLASLKYRLLASDFTETLQSHGNLCFPPRIHDVEQTKLAGPIAVQVLDIVDVGSSKMEQLEKVEMEGRGERVRGREVIRVVPEEEEGETGKEETKKRKGVCKLLLEDAAGLRVWGFELRTVVEIKVGMAVGTKMVLRDVPVSHGVLLFSPDTTTVLGGKIEALNLQFLADREKTLKRAIEEIENRRI